MTKTKAEEELEKSIARKILEKNPKLREAGIDTMGIVERTQTARKGAKSTIGQKLGGLDATPLDTLRDEYENQLAEIAAKIALLEQQKLALKKATHDKVGGWVAAQKDQAALKQALDLRKIFLDKIGFKRSGL